MKKRTYCILPSSPLNPTRPLQRQASPTLASPRTAKPTNVHSKFTGKSKDMIKGSRSKLRSSLDDDLGHGGLLAWRVTVKYDYESWPYYKVRLDSQSASDIWDELYGDDDDFDMLEFLRDEEEDYPSSYYGKYLRDYIVPPKRINYKLSDEVDRSRIIVQGESERWIAS